MPIQKLCPTYTFNQDKIQALKTIFPEAFADGHINFHLLRDLLGDAVDDDLTEHFGLTWPGKREARRLVGPPSLKFSWLDN